MKNCRSIRVSSFLIYSKKKKVTIRSNNISNYYNEFFRGTVSFYDFFLYKQYSQKGNIIDKKRIDQYIEYISLISYTERIEEFKKKNDDERYSNIPWNIENTNINKTGVNRA